MEPDPVDPQSTVLRKQIFRDRIQQFRFPRHIPAAGGIRVDEVELKSTCSFGLFFRQGTGMVEIGKLKRFFSRRMMR